MTVTGIVQGVGFRPFVYRTAIDCHLAGFVRNDGNGVTIEVEGPSDDLDAFRKALDQPPPLARVDTIASETIAPEGDTEFRIVTTHHQGPRHALVSPDMATCADCLAELWDPSDRRYRYPFINCTNCGPRYTIVQDVPYDRAATTMARFVMCPDCQAEYDDPGDRRFHAQPNACPVCGPRLRMLDSQGRPVDAHPVELLKQGAILAVKGLGGYHLAVDATHSASVAALRARKHREEKPFAVMVPDLDAAHRLADLSPEETALLTSPARPIVLVQARPDSGIAPAVAPGNRYVGLFLPYTPLHHILLRDVGTPLVLTSGNRSDEPIVHVDEEAPPRLGGICDFILSHDRPIHIRTDDSVARVMHGAPITLRRSRGYAPGPVRVATAGAPHILAVGAELKSTICLLRDGQAFLSHHLGDLENYETWLAFRQAIDHLQRLFDVQPRCIAHDLHPEYMSTKWAMEQDLPLLGVQHHHAHIASCMADNGVQSPVLGVALDGLGYGPDGTIWGGEFLVADWRGYTRLGHLRTVPMPGGTAAIRAPWRMALAYLRAAYGDALPAVPPVGQHDTEAAVLEAVRRGVNAPATSSMGRLFDAVSAILGIRQEVSYEGQAAIELEQRADARETGTYRTPLHETETGFVLDGPALVRNVVEDCLQGCPPETVAARFHHAVADAVVEACQWMRDRHPIDTVALSGGVFQNVLLTGAVVDRLRRLGFTPIVHRQVPCNDGGISLGQAVVAAAATI